MTYTSKKIRILQLLPALNEGGVELGTLQLATYLQKHHIYNMVASNGGRQVSALKKEKVPHITLSLHTKNPFKILLNAYKLTLIIKKFRLTHLHARSRAPAWSAYIACAFFNKFNKNAHVIFLTTFHGTYSAKTKIKRWYNSVMLKGDIIIANSAFVKNHIITTYGAQKAPIHIVLRGNDPLIFNKKTITEKKVAAFRKSVKANKTTPLILMVGRLTRWKGQTVLLTALAKMKDKPWVAVIAGGAKNPAYLEELKSIAKNAHIANRVHFLGSRNDTPLLYTAADIAVSASIEPEAFGRVAIEAQAMATPIIATAHGGSLETVIHEKTGFLIPPNNAKKLKETLVKALTDPKKLATIGAAGCRHVSKNLTAEIMCKGETEAYFMTLKNKN